MLKSPPHIKILDFFLIITYNYLYMEEPVAVRNTMQEHARKGDKTTQFNQNKSVLTILMSWFMFVMYGTGDQICHSSLPLLSASPIHDKKITCVQILICSSYLVQSVSAVTPGRKLLRFYHSYCDTNPPLYG